MPPKQKITSEMILKAGYEIARSRGIDNVNSRNISRLLSCSTQPIFSCFSTMEELRKGVFDYISQKYMHDGNDYVNLSNSSDFLSLSIQWYLTLLRNEPQLYKILYFSNACGKDIPDSFIARYTNNPMVQSKIQMQYLLDAERSADILVRASALLHGIGTLIFFNGYEISDEEITDMIRRTVEEMVCSAQQNNCNNPER